MSEKKFHNICVILITTLNIINSIEYFIGSSKGNYSDAINICYNDGGILAIITNEYQFNISRQICMNNNTNCWIGLNNILNIDEWRYIDGTSVKGIYGFDNNGNPTYGHGPWSHNQPNYYHEVQHCVHFWNSHEYYWNDDNCLHIYRPLCMKVDATPMKQFCKYMYIWKNLLCLQKK